MNHDSRMSRRNFIATSVGGLTAVGLGTLPGSSLFAQDAAPQAAATGEIIQRTLGRTGLHMPIVSMGVMNSNTPHIVDAAYDAGVRHFDTAARYQYGRNEQMVGHVIDKKGVRDQVVIATKIMRPAQRGEMTAAESRAKLEELCEGSLRRLKTDYIDILYIHSVEQADDFGGETQDAMAALREQGRIRAAGVSTHRNMAAVINQVVTDGVYDVVLTAINVTMADDVELLAAIDRAAEAGVGIVAMKTQAGGRRLPNQESLSTFSSSVIATASLKWVMRNQSIHTSIPGFDNYQHMAEDFSVARDLEYTEDEKKFLTDNDVKLSMGFCRQCAQCLPSCPHGVDVPTLMRTYMYAAQYANFHEARTALGEIAPRRGLDACSQCGTCTAQCAHTVEIARRIGTLKEIYS